MTTLNILKGDTGDSPSFLRGDLLETLQVSQLIYLLIQFQWTCPRHQTGAKDEDSLQLLKSWKVIEARFGFIKFPHAAIDHKRLPNFYHLRSMALVSAP